MNSASKNSQSTEKDTSELCKNRNHSYLAFYGPGPFGPGNDFVYCLSKLIELAVIVA